MGDTHPLTSSEHFALSDVGDSRTDLNRDPDDNFREGKPSIFSQYNANGRIIIVTIAVLCFTLAFFLFIGTIVVYYSRPVSPACTLDSFTQSVQENKAIAASAGQLDFNNRYNKNHDKVDDHETTPTPQVLPPAFKPLDEWSVTQVNGKHVRPGVLIYNEEFDALNSTIWENVLGESDNHFYYYVSDRTNSYVKDGKLYLKPTFTSEKYGNDYIYNGTLFLGMIPSPKCLNESQSALCWKQSNQIVHPIMSAMLTSKNSLSFRYGRLVIRAKMPGGDWLEPIMSLQPTKSFYGENLLSGQVHLTDTRGNKKLMDASGQHVGSEQTCPDIRFGSRTEKKVLFYCLNTEENKGFDTEFHDYEVLWTPDSITVKIDGEGIVSAPYPRPSIYKLLAKGRHINNPWVGADSEKVAPFDRAFHLVMGVSVGGTTGFFHDEFEGPYPKPWKNHDPSAPKTFWENRNNWEPSWEGDNAALQIESIKLWSLNITTMSD